MGNKTFYIIIYDDYYDCPKIKGVFTSKSKAEKCKTYELKRVDIQDKKDGGYGRIVKMLEVECSDHIDFDKKILELEEQELKKQRAKEEAIKKKDLEEFNRIKAKYGL